MISKESCLILIINSLKEHNFITNGAAIKKIKEQPNSCQYILLNLLPRANFDQIYEIEELCCVSVNIERFRSRNIVNCATAASVIAIFQKFAILHPDALNVLRIALK